MHHEWILAPEPDTSLVQHIAEENSIHPAVASVLVSRGFDAEKAAAHLNLSLQGLHDPFSMMGMRRAADRVLEAIRKKEKILVHGDYDVDGIAGSALLYTFLKSHNSHVKFYIPNRLEEGYGLSERGVSFAAEVGATLLITVDCGIGELDEVELARKSDIDVIVTDHHEPKSDLPRAHTILNPKCEDQTYPFADLSGCGVAFKLLQAVSVELGEKREESFRDLDLVALATVCDIVPMVGENRIFARFGMEILSESEKPGIVALKQVAGIGAGEISAYHLGFMLGPRLNAAGRIASAADGLKLLVTDDPKEAGIIANRLDAQNAKRRELDARISDEATRMVEDEFDLSTTAGIVLAAEGWHEGVIGIVASRIVEKFHRPTVVISIAGKKGKGSARSTRNVNLYGALEKCKDVLTGFGGHQYAAGLTIESDKVDRFKDKFNEAVKETVSIDELQPKLFVDAKLTIQDVDDYLLSSLERLRPFGIKNARPVFVSENVEVVGDPAIFGKGHLKFKVRDGGSVQSAKAFRMGDMIGALSARPRVDIVYSVRKDKYFGKESTALYVLDIKVTKTHVRSPE